MPARKPEECDLLFGDHVNAGDLDALVALYEPTCPMAQRDGGLIVGHEAIRANLQRLLAMKPRMTIRVTQVLAAGDLAMVYNDWSFTGVGPDGAPVARSGRAVEVVRRQPDGTWRFAVDDPLGRSRGDA
jgi:uncharacterized protein (TIGR02246 family)